MTKPFIETVTECFLDGKLLNEGIIKYKSMHLSYFDYFPHSQTYNETHYLYPLYNQLGVKTFSQVNTLIYSNLYFYIQYTFTIEYCEINSIYMTAHLLYSVIRNQYKYNNV